MKWLTRCLCQVSGRLLLKYLIPSRVEARANFDSRALVVSLSVNKSLFAEKEHQIYSLKYLYNPIEIYMSFLCNLMKGEISLSVHFSFALKRALKRSCGSSGRSDVGKYRMTSDEESRTTMMRPCNSLDYNSCVHGSVVIWLDTFNWS